MAVNLVELAKGYLTPDIITKAASFVGESEPATQKAMNGIVPTLIAGWLVRRQRAAAPRSSVVSSTRGSTMAARSII
jgi:OmpA-OmpF porin, OOP family